MSISARVEVVHMPAGGLIGRHEADVRQLFAVVAGAGWVSGQEGRRVIGSRLEVRPAVRSKRAGEGGVGTRQGARAGFLGPPGSRQDRWSAAAQVNGA